MFQHCVGAFHSCQRFFEAVRVLRAPIILSLLAFFVLSGPAQVHEIYLILVRGRAELALQATLAVLSLVLLSVFIIYASRCLVRSAGEERAGDGRPHEESRFLVNLPVVLGVLPLLGAALGLWRALKSTLTETAQSAVGTIAALRSETLVTAALERAREAGNIPGADGGRLNFKQINDRVDLTISPAVRALPDQAQDLAIVIEIAIAVCLLLAALVVVLYFRKRRWVFLVPTTWVFHPAVAFAIAVVFLLLTGLVAAQHLNAGRDAGFDFTRIPRALGTLALLNVSLMGLVFATSLLSHWADRHKIPLLVLLAVFAAVISAQNWNDNHHVRLVESPPADLEARRSGTSATPLLHEAFLAWFRQRPEAYRRRFDGRPYPIYVVAAQGGGMYAANLSGLTLARLYDRCPAIRHHLFAVSGVSGGSVGAGYLAALLAEADTAGLGDHCSIDPPQGGVGSFEKTMEALLQADLLAPVAASFLFPDLVQRLVPFPIAAFDRARAFEAGVEEAWRATVKTGANRLRQPFWRHWRPDGAAPMLFLNTTVAETGHQLVVAPVKFDSVRGFTTFDLTSLRESAGLPDEIDVPLSTAMSLSARFPLVMPAGLVSTPTAAMHLVDGGYFENSGVETAEIVVRRLQRKVCFSYTVDFSNCVHRKPRESDVAFAFRSIVLTDFDDQSRLYRIGEDPRKDGAGLDELLSPLRAMLNTRVARGELAVDRLSVLQPGMPANPGTIPTIRIELNHRLYALPLGWQLSRQVQEIISAQIGDPVQCVRAGSSDFTETLGTVKAIERGFELIAAQVDGRTPQARHSLYTPPLVDVLSRLQRNHCVLFDALAADGVVPEPAPAAQVQVQ